MGPSGVKAIREKLPDLIEQKKIDFVIVNGENAGDRGVGITKEIFNEFIKAGADVVTTGNHVWDEMEAMDLISKDQRLLRPANLIKGSPGNGMGIYKAKNKKKVAVLNLMGNVFMKKCQDVFQEAQKFIKNIKLKENADFIIVDMHGEITSEKMAIGYFLDGKVTMIVGTHTHVPTSDHRVMEKGTAYQTDLGMCGDYNSVIGMNKEISLNRFLKKTTDKNYPSNGNASLCGVIVDADDNSGLANKAESFIFSGEHKAGI